MATAKKPTEKKLVIDDNQIISFYMTDVFENREATKNVYSFCKAHQIEESLFYSFFSSMEMIQQEIWQKFFENTITTIHKETTYPSYTPQNKLLTLYFTLFEILTLNRSYIVHTLENKNEGLKTLKQLKKLRNSFKDFVATIMEKPESMDTKITKITQPVITEGAWIQFLFVLKFWLDDTSKGFEKTDIIIEKSVNTAIGLLDTKPLENLFDLGKFLWKEQRVK